MITEVSQKFTTSYRFVFQRQSTPDRHKPPMLPPGQLKNSKETLSWRKMSKQSSAPAALPADRDWEACVQEACLHYPSAPALSRFFQDTHLRDSSERQSTRNSSRLQTALTAAGAEDAVSSCCWRGGQRRSTRAACTPCHRRELTVTHRTSDTAE